MRIGKSLKYFGFALALGTFLTVKCDNVDAATVIANDKLPETITKGEVKYVFAQGVNETSGKSNQPFYSEDSTGEYQLYCSDRNNGNFTGSYTLTKGKRLDYGLTAILVRQDNIYHDEVYTRVLANSVYTNGDSNENAIAKDLLNTWITQMAIWGYQGTFSSGELVGDVGISYKHYGDNVTGYEIYTNQDYSSKLVTTAMWQGYVDSLIKEAQEVNAKSPYDATMTVKTEGDWTTIKGTKSVKSGLIDVSLGNGDVTAGSAVTNMYSLSFDNAPSGLKVYKEDGTEVTDLSSIPVSDKVYFVVDKSNMKEDYKFTVKVNSTVEYNAPYQYVDKETGRQPSILVGSESKQMSANMEMTLSPDTALSVSNSIYFLGLLILVSGVFVIYVNVKTKKQVSE